MENTFKDSLVESLLRSDQTVADLNIQTTYNRQVWGVLDKYVRNFLLHQGSNQWLIMPGLRGIGKTTLLTQLYNHPALTRQKIRKFYFSFENLTLPGASVNDFVEAVKHLRHTRPEEVFFIFLDEVHFDPKWSLGCKIIFDQVPNVFMVCTGSSALSLRLNPDSARRVDMVKVHPLSFEEFTAINQVNAGAGSGLINPAPDLSQRLRDALFHSADIEQVYSELQNCEKDVDEYYRSLEDRYGSEEQGTQTTDQLLENYICGYGSLPHPPRQADNKQQTRMNFQSKQAPSIIGPDSDEYFKDRILRMIDQTLVQDTIKLLAEPTNDSRLGFQLQASTINLLPQLVTILANSERISLTKLAQRLSDTHQKTLRMMLRVLIASDMIVEVAPFGASLGKTSKTPKYLFGAPALRQALIPLKLANLTTDNHISGVLRGRLLEDTVIMYLERIFDTPSRNMVVEYDSKSGGADFVITADGQMDNSIVMEVGYRKTTSRQVRQTLGKGGLYGLVITTGNKLRLETASKAMYVPLRYFLLA